MTTRAPPSSCALGVLVASFAFAPPALAKEAPEGSSASASLAPEPPAADTPVKRQSVGRGFAFAPSRPEGGGFRLGLGILFDAVDPATMYGMTIRIPQITLDARYGLGSGWSLKGHLNTYLITNELLLGAGYTWQFGRWSLEAAMSAGVYYGRLNQLGFSTDYIAGEYRPELSLGWDLGDVMLSLRGSLILMGPQRVRVGELWGGLDNADAFTGHSEMLYVENTTASNALWYLGIGAMTTRAYYQMWLLFPDAPDLFTYPRLVAGYEF